MSTKSLPSEVKAAINENTGIIYDNKTTQETREAAEKDNARIFREYGKTARQHYNSIIGKIKEGDTGGKTSAMTKIKRFLEAANPPRGNFFKQLKEDQAEFKKKVEERKRLNEEAKLKKDKGGNISKKSNKKDKIAVMIAVGKPKMSYGGSVKGKKHFYTTGGVAIDNLPNKGAKALAKTEKGRQALRNMGVLKNGNKTT